MALLRQLPSLCRALVRVQAGRRTDATSHSATHSESPTTSCPCYRRRLVNLAPPEHLSGWRPTSLPLSHFHLWGTAGIAPTGRVSNSC
jgi:hypothetical protein